MSNNNERTSADWINSLIHNFNKVDWEGFKDMINQMPGFAEAVRSGLEEMKALYLKEIETVDKNYQKLSECISKQIDVLNRELEKDTYTAEEKERIYSKIENLLIMMSDELNKATHAKKEYFAIICTAVLAGAATVAAAVVKK